MVTKNMKQILGKPILKSKVFWVNLITALLAAFELFRGNSLSPGVLVIAGILNIALRFLTSQPVTLK